MNKRKSRVIPITYRGEELDSSNQASLSFDAIGVNDYYLIDRFLNGFEFEISYLDDAIGDPIANLNLYTHDPIDGSD
jgi:hypothetical protein